MPTRSPWPCLALALATACPSTHVQPLPVAASAPAASPTAPAPPVAQLPATLAPTPGCTVEPGDILAEPIVAGSLDDAAVRHAVTQQLDRIGACVDWAVGYAVFCVFVECLLNMGGLLVWEYPFWNRSFGGVWLIFLFGYFHFYVAAILVLGLSTLKKKLVAVGCIYAVAVVANVVALGLLGWVY